MKVNVQFTDNSETVLKAFFGGPQNPADYPNLGLVDDTDPRYLAFIDPASTLPGAKAKQIKTLYDSCTAAICANFSALSDSYPASLLDQQNMVQCAANANGGRLMAQVSGVWELVSHSQSEAQTVLAAFVSERDIARVKLQALVSQVNNASTVAAVQSIVW